MSIESVTLYLKQFNRDKDVLEFPVSSATVELAAQALNTEPQRIAKTLAFKENDSCIVVVAAGDAKVDNQKFKQTFGYKAKMLTFEETLELTGHAVDGVCPFDLPDGVKAYLDISMRRFDFVYPACGSSNSAIKLTCDELEEYSKAEKWVDVCKAWEENS